MSKVLNTIILKQRIISFFKMMYNIPYAMFAHFVILKHISTYFYSNKKFPSTFQELRIKFW